MAKKKYNRYQISTVQETYTYYDTEPIFETRIRRRFGDISTLSDEWAYNPEEPSVDYAWERIVRRLKDISWDPRECYKNYRIDKENGVLEGVELLGNYNINVGDKIYLLPKKLPTYSKKADFIELTRRQRSAGLRIFSFDVTVETYQEKVGERQVKKQGTRPRKQKGNYIDFVVADEGVYPRDGEYNGYWYVMTNEPSIQLSSESSGELGEKNRAFPIAVLIRHIDTKTRVTLSVSLDNRVLQTFPDIDMKTQKSVSYTITESEFSRIPTGKRCTLTFRAEDKYGQSATKVFYFTKSNTTPIISGSDEALGSKNDEFSVTYSVSDNDLSDQLTCTEYLNGLQIRRLTNVPKNQTQRITITREKLFSLPLNTTNTIEVKVEDNSGAVAYRRWTFARTNSAPVISGTDSDLGAKTSPFSISFSATDHENDAMSAVLFLDDKILKEYNSVQRGVQQTYAFDKLSFSQVEHGVPHKLRIEVRDAHGATSIRTFTFTRTLTELSYTMIKDTDQRVSKITINPTWHIAQGATGRVEVCNNARDTSPTWEDMTSQAKEGRHFNLTNKTKTAGSWAVGVRVSIQKGTSTTKSWLGGFGGGYQ